MNLNDSEKIKYIKNNFHQYLDLELNLTDLQTTEIINLVIPFENLYTTNDVNEILEKYDDTNIEKEQYVYCTYVTDGDTIWVKNATVNEETGIISLGKQYKVLFSGINTPEVGEEGYELSTAFTKQCCLNKFFYLNIDSEMPTDTYGRTLGVVIVKNKNLNEVLLKENLAVSKYVPPSEFNPDSWEDSTSVPSTFNPDNIDVSILKPYLNEKMSNVVFTSTTNYDNLYRYEIYKNVFYIKLNPYVSTVRMHLLPKFYDCSNTGILILKDDHSAKKSITSNYKYYSEKDTINTYFQENGEDRDRNNITNKNYISDEWGDAISTDTYAEFSYDISKDTKTFNNLQICTGYRYNNTSPFYALHYTGVKDNTNSQPEDRCTLIDLNADNTQSEQSNVITQMNYENENVFIPHTFHSLKEYGNTDHTTKINVLHRKTLKYINDLLYCEDGEYYGSCEWKDLSEVQ